MSSFKKLSFFLALIASLSLTGCGSSSKKKNSNQPGAADTSLEGTNEGMMDLELNGDSDSGKAGALQTVNFAFNSSSLSSMARATLEQNAEFLKNNPSVEVQVEGHCDERGGVQYNIALGERRANSVKQFLVAMGVSSARISTISFGKDRPIAFGHDESAWAQNRRANFVVTSK